MAVIPNLILLRSVVLAGRADLSHGQVTRGLEVVFWVRVVLAVMRNRVALTRNVRGRVGWHIWCAPTSLLVGC